MNGPRHSNGSLSSPSCPTARFSAIPPTKQSCLELLITPMMDIGRRIWDTNNYGQAFSSDTLLYFLIFIRFNYTFEFDPIKVNERGNCRCCTDRIRFGIFATISAGRKGEGERKKSIFFLISMQNTRDPSWFVLLGVDIRRGGGRFRFGAKNPVTLVSRPPPFIYMPVYTIHGVGRAREQWNNRGSDTTDPFLTLRFSYFFSLFSSLTCDDLTARATFSNTFPFSRLISTPLCVMLEQRWRNIFKKKK